MVKEHASVHQSPDFTHIPLIGSANRSVFYAIKGNPMENPAGIIFGGLGDFDKTPIFDGKTISIKEDPDQYMEKFATLLDQKGLKKPYAFALFNTPHDEKTEFNEQDPTSILDLAIFRDLTTSLIALHEKYPQAKPRILGNSYGATLLLVTYYAAIKEICDGKTNTLRYERAKQFLQTYDHTAKDTVLFNPALGYNDIYFTPNIVASRLAASKSPAMKPLKYVSTAFL